MNDEATEDAFDFRDTRASSEVKHLSRENRLLCTRLIGKTSKVPGLHTIEFRTLGHASISRSRRLTILLCLLTKKGCSLGGLFHAIVSILCFIGCVLFVGDVNSRRSRILVGQVELAGGEVDSEDAGDGGPNDGDDKVHRVACEPILVVTRAKLLLPSDPARTVFVLGIEGRKLGQKCAVCSGGVGDCIPQVAPSRTSCNRSGPTTEDAITGANARKHRLEGSSGRRRAEAASGRKGVR